MLCRSTPVSVINPKTVIRENWGKESKGEELMYIAPIRNKVITFFYGQRRIFCIFLCEYIKRIWKRMSHITPTAKRNTYSVAIIVGPATQGSGLRPQPWAGKTQLRQSCQGCVPNSDVHGQLYLGGMGLAHGVWCASNEGLAHCGRYAHLGGMVLVHGV